MPKPQHAKAIIPRRVCLLPFVGLYFCNSIIMIVAKKTIAIPMYTNVINFIS